MKSIIMGLIQGLTEFLPVSSSGHLVVMKNLLHIGEKGIEWEVFLHLGTFLSIILYFNKRIINYLKPKPLLLIIIGTIPAGIVGYLFKSNVESTFSNYIFTIPAFLFTGVILFLTKFTKGERKELNYRDAILIGCAQAIALLPGVSRSGMTISTALFLGLGFYSAFEFSFMLAIPALAGAFILETSKMNFSNLHISPIIVGTTVAFLSGLFALYLLDRILKIRRLYLFSFYVWFISFLLMAALFFRI